jgi:hypothetical protein
MNKCEYILYFSFCLQNHLVTITATIGIAVTFNSGYFITINANNKKEVKDYLDKSPLIKYWNYEIVELFVYDSQSTRLPAVQLN